MARIGGGDRDRMAAQPRQRGDHAEPELGAQLDHAVAIGQRADDSARVEHRLPARGNCVAQRALVIAARIGQRTLVPCQDAARLAHRNRFVVDQQIDAAGARNRVGRPHRLGCHHAQAAPFDHRRAAHADAGAARRDHIVAAAEQRGVAGEAIAFDDADRRHLPRQRGQRAERRAVQTRYRRGIHVAGAPATAFGEQHERQLQLGSHLEQSIGLAVVVVALRAGQHRIVVGHRGHARALGPEVARMHQPHAGDQPVGRRVLLQVVERSAAALRGDGIGAVLDEAVGIEQRRDVLACRAPALRMARAHHLRPRRIGQQRAARMQLVELGSRCRRSRGRRGTRHAVGERCHVDQRVAFIDRIAALHVDRLHHAVGQRLDRELHLHRLQAQQHRAARHRAADVGLDGGDGALHAGAVVDERGHRTTSASGGAHIVRGLSWRLPGWGTAHAVATRALLDCHALFSCTGAADAASEPRFHRPGGRDRADARGRPRRRGAWRKPPSCCTSAESNTAG